MMGVFKNVLFCIVFCAIIKNSLSNAYDNEEDEDYYHNDEYEYSDEDDDSSSKKLNIEKRAPFGGGSPISNLGGNLGVGINTPIGGFNAGLGGGLTGSGSQASAGSNSLIGGGLGGKLNTPIGGFNAGLGLGLTGSGSQASAGSNTLIGGGVNAGLNLPVGGLGSTSQATGQSNSLIGAGLGGELTGSGSQASAGSNSLIGGGLGAQLNNPLGELNGGLGAGLIASGSQASAGSNSLIYTGLGVGNTRPSSQVLPDVEAHLPIQNDQSQGGVKGGVKTIPKKVVDATTKLCTTKPMTINAKLKCSNGLCKSKCIPNFEFPHGEQEIYINCVDGDWIVKNSDYGDEIPSCEPICLPQCQNKGICIEPGKCECPENFVGPQCQYENKQCLQKPAMPKNAISSCSPTTCTFQCTKGYRFPDGTAIMNMICKNGDWAPSRQDLVSIPDCQPTCTPECLNGGNCLAYNVCNCPDEFRGAQCQYSIDVCSPKKLVFNGAYHCESNSVTMECNINCPQGIQFEFPPADKYICEYSTGLYLPSNIPQCILNGNVSNSHNIMNEPLKPETHLGIPHYNFDENTDFSKIQLPGLYSIYVDKGDKAVINKTPKPAMCTIWNGNTVKTFDGLVYNIPIHCSHTLVQDEIDGTFSIILRTCSSLSEQPCPYSLDIFIQNLQYSFENVEGKIKLFTPQKELPIPAQLSGLRVTMVGSSLKISLETIQTTIIWDTNKMISIEATASLWNRTSGLCGTLDKTIDNDMTSKQGNVLKVRKIFIDSWRAPNLDTDEKCLMERNQDIIEKECDAKTKAAAAIICRKLVTSTKFKTCLPLFDKNSLLASCISDYCNCEDQTNPAQCVCDSIAVIVKDCQFQGVRLDQGWRDLEICPLNCTDGRLYKACGPSFEPSCGSAIEIESTMCHEGCFCPDGTLQNDGKCVQPEACPCSLRGKVFTPGTKITRDCNTCSCENGLWKCTDATCGSRCAAVGDPHYVTFDGKRYDFVGKCSYYLLKTDNYSVEAENVACPGGMSDLMGSLPTSLSEGSSCTKSITINIPHGFNGKSQQIRLKQGRQILVDGLEVNKLPKNLQQGMIKIRQASSLVTSIEFQDGIKVWWDGISRVYIDAPASYRGKTKGLCGTFNNNLQDDFLTPEGDIEATVGPFGDKWRTKESCQFVADLPHAPHPCQMNIENKAKAEKLCSKLVSHIFDDCHWSVDPTPFYEDCLYDVCACKGDLGLCSCPIFSAYAAECSRQNIIINWRYSVHECAVKCPTGQIYEQCGDACSRTCEDLQSEVPCKTSCVEGCRCPSGQVLDDRQECVPIAACSCTFKGLIFNPGYKEIRPGLKFLELCTCMGARWICNEALNDDAQKYPPAADIRNKCQNLQNEEFTTCEPESVLTCKNMHLPFEETTPADCHPGCVCKKGYVFDVSEKKCVLPKDCSCHHGGRSYNDGEKMFEECNTCTCNGGTWSCTTNPCASTCSAWGDSHFETYDGKDYDFQGVCDYVLSKGILQGGEGFSVTLQNVLCGSLGVTCSKSVTIALLGANGESITLDADSPIPGIKTYDEPTKALKVAHKPNKLSIHRAGIFIIVEAPGYGLQVKWDRGTRVYIKLQNKWKGRVVGLCGNYNGDANDDLKSPSGGIETSPLIFGHSWKLQDFCSVPTEPIDACESHPLRKTWAQRKCGVLKSDLFRACHSEVPVEKYLKRCIFDTCACDQGGDCECLCTALAAYAHACTMRGVPIKWRTQELCPMQCDPLCSSYSSCVSACPVETCDNMLDQAKSNRMCHEDICVEGCNIKPCPEGFKYLNDTFKECVPQALCKPVCLEINGVVYYEGDVIKTDECQTCRCSRGKEKCIGEPCKPTTHPTVIPPMLTEPVKCVSGWTSWFNQDNSAKLEPGTKRPSKGELKEGDLEPVPSHFLMKSTTGYAVCEVDNITAIDCRTVGTHHSPKSLDEDVECSLERGLLCAGPCHDYEIRAFCVCKEEEETTTSLPETTTPTTFEMATVTVGKPRTVKGPRRTTTTTSLPTTIVAQTTIVTISLCNASISSIEHSTDCEKFLECAPTGGYTVLKSCDKGLMYNPVTRICDWPSSVIAIKPKCETIVETPKPTPWQGTTPKYIHPTTTKPVITTPECEEGFVWDNCALPCGKACNYYGKSLVQSGQCPPTGAQECLEGCTDSESAITCPPGYLYRNKLGCVKRSDCPCMSKLGHLVKPGEIYKEECETCQCLDNQYVCTASSCITTKVPSYTTGKVVTRPTTGAPTAGPTPAPTPALTEGPTLPPTKGTTSGTTTGSTSGPTTGLTSAPTTGPTPAPTMGSTPAPTAGPTTASTAGPTTAQTMGPTPASTAGPTTALTMGPTPISTAESTVAPTPAPTTIASTPRVEYPTTYIPPLAIHSTVTPPTKCDPNNLVPLIDGEIPLPDTIFSASSDQGTGYLPKDARLQSNDNESSGGWSPGINDQAQYLQITFPQLTPIFGIIVGPNKLGDFVTSFKVVYTTETVINLDTPFFQVVDENKKPQIFPGPIDGKSVPQTLFKIPVEAKTIRIYPITWENGIALRAEVIGCSSHRLTTVPSETTLKEVPTTTEYVSTTLKVSTTEKVVTTEKGTTILNVTTVTIVPTTEKITTVKQISTTEKATSEKPRPTTTERITTITVKEIIPVCIDPMGMETGSIQPHQIKVSSTKPSDEQPKPYYETLKLNSPEGWKPILNSPQQFVKFDFLEPRNLTGVTTQGGPQGWVTGYNVLFSHDDKTYNEILDHNKEQKVYIANYDSNTPVTNYFDLPINAQFLKIIPVNWHDTIELKVEPLGCYKAYPTQPPSTTLAPTTPLPPGCGLCEGIVLVDDVCKCYEPLRWDGHNCINATECPCVHGIHTYNVGAKYETEDCQECICTIGGVAKCDPKQCEKCPPGLRTAKSDSCACLCEPCPPNTKMCVTNELCIDENLWCNGVIDCPDDELDCVKSTTAYYTTQRETTKQPKFTKTTTEATTPYVPTTERAATPGFVPPTLPTTKHYETTKVHEPTTTSKPPIIEITTMPPVPCPEPKCPPDHIIDMNSTLLPIKSAIYEIVTELPQVITTFTKTSQRLEQTILPRPATELIEDVEILCPQFKCIPQIPHNLIECKPQCPEGYNVVVEPIKSANIKECPLFTCTPPIVDVFCNITGKTFNTFDGTKYKYQICNHVLARDLKDLLWNVTLRQNCSAGNYACKKEIEIQDGKFGFRIVIYQDLTAEIDGYRYTIDQINSADKFKGIFSIVKIGGTVLFTSAIHGFYVKFDEFGDVTVSVSSINKNHVDGLCGFYNDDLADDKRLPNGNLAANTEEFGNSWYVNSTEPDFCEPHACSRDLQLEAYHLCTSVQHDVFKQCSSSLDIDSYVSMCTETSCTCLQEQLVDSKDKLTPKQYAEQLKTSAQKCKCDVLQHFSSQCLQANEQVDLSSWRAQENCDIACPPPLIYKDCYRRKCETTCKTVDTNDCPYVPGHCFSGCYCPEGTVRKGDHCVAISECRDCDCTSFGKSQYLTYDRANFTFDANCTYLLSRDTLKPENYNFQVYVTLGPCEAESNALQTTTKPPKFVIPEPGGQKSPHGTCTHALHILIDSHAVEISRGNVKNVLELAVDGTKPKSLPLKEKWVQISEEQSTHLKVLLVAEQVEVIAEFKDFTFSVRVPSYKYGSVMEGLCGDCNRNKTNDFTPKPEGLEKLSAEILKDPVKKFAYSWLADESRLNLTEPNCLVVEVEEVCKLPPPKDNPCLKILDEDIFGSCHSIVSPVTYVASCQKDLCTDVKPNACDVLSAYAKDCARHGVCLNWRQSTLCPFDCPSSLRYNPCGCAETCESIKEREKLIDAQVSGIKTTKRPALTDVCTVEKAEGCFCPKGQVLRGNVCIPERECTPCDKEGHFPGDKWYPDICTTCECDNNAKTVCSKKDCMVKDIVCDNGYEPLVTADKLECCPKYTCVLKPTEAPPKECPIAVLPKCGEGQRAKSETDEFNCPKYVCECVPKSECPAPPEFKLPLKPGMKIVSDEPGCCVVKSLICDNTTCPPKLKGCADEYYEVVKKNVIPENGEELCCDEYVCEPPSHSCIVEMNDKKYLKEYNEKWQVEDNLCLVKECIMGIDGKPIVKDIVTNCDKTCEPGFEYVEVHESCCGKCVQTKCVIDNKVHELDAQWHENNDNCTTFACTKFNDTYVITKTTQPCPDISECAEERKYIQGCCTLCKPAPPPTLEPTCVPEPLKRKTVGLIKEQHPTHGLCVNTQPTDELKVCAGGCLSGTQYNDIENRQDQFCKCCYPVELISITVELTCDDGFTLPKQIESPKTCGCNECGPPKSASFVKG